MLLPPIAVDANKYTRGSLLIIGGSTRFTGAPILAAQAAARSGAGYVNLAVPASIAAIAQTHLLTIPLIAAPEKDGALRSDAAAFILEQCAHYDAILLGPGLTLTPETAAFVSDLLTQVSCSSKKTPLVLDADALGALATVSSTVLTQIATPLILTPHAGELKRLLQAFACADARDLAKHLRDAPTAPTAPAAHLAPLAPTAPSAPVIVVAKGPETLVTDGENDYLFSESTPALAKAGTGDVLAGLIVSLLAQGANAWDAACSGVELHARAGRLAETSGGRRGLIARDIIDMLAKALKEIEGI
jgi:NAD(P)H-hydrate epimerase